MALDLLAGPVHGLVVIQCGPGQKCKVKLFATVGII